MQNILQKKETKKNCHPFNISIFSLAKFEFWKSTKIWNVNVPSGLNFWIKFDYNLKFPYANTDLYSYVVWYSGLFCVNLMEKMLQELFFFTYRGGCWCWYWLILWICTESLCFTWRWEILVQIWQGKNAKVEFAQLFKSYL